MTEGLGGLDILAHSIAYAPSATFEGRFIETARADFHTSVDISAYSMVAMARAPSRTCAPAAAARW